MEAAVGGASPVTSWEEEELQYKCQSSETPADKQSRSSLKHSCNWMDTSPLRSSAISNMSSHTGFLLLITLWASVQDGLSLPLMKQLKTEASDRVPSHSVRSKRCACSSQLDSECHYFCHLDIIWVNTPSKTIVYGLGSGLSRRRRSAGRCTCANIDDHTCTNFCSNSFEITSPKRSAKTLQLNILSILKAVAARSKRAQNSPDSGGDESSEAGAKNAH